MATFDTSNCSQDNELSDGSPFFTRGASYFVQGSREVTLGVDNNIVGNGDDRSGVTEAQIDQEKTPKFVSYKYY